MSGFLGPIVGTLSLLWAIIWSIWVYRRVHSPKMLVNIQPAVFSSGPNIRFVPEKGGKPSRIPQGALLAMFVSIQTQNIGPVSITIDKIRVVPADHKQKPFLLENCWVAMKREEQLPKVIASGDFWEGWCDYQWLIDKLESSVAVKKRGFQRQMGSRFPG